MSKVFNMVGGGGGATASIFVKGLSQTDTVTATNGSKTKVGVWTQILNPAYVVPDGYTQLEYIESSGTQYIDTEISPNRPLHTTTEVSFSPNTSNWSIPFGSNTNHSSGANGYQIMRNTSNTLYFIYSVQHATSMVLDSDKFYKLELDAVEGSQELRVNNAVV